MMSLQGQMPLYFLTYFIYPLVDFWKGRSPRYNNIMLPPLPHDVLHDFLNCEIESIIVQYFWSEALLDFVMKKSCQDCDRATSYFRNRVRSIRRGTIFAIGQSNRHSCLYLMRFSEPFYAGCSFPLICPPFGLALVVLRQCGDLGSKIWEWLLV